MAEGRRVVVTGATGLIGRALSAELVERGYELVVFSRDPEEARRKVPGAAKYVRWRSEESGPWMAAIAGAYGVVSLAGASIAGSRWTEGYKRKLYDSRILGTRGLVHAMERSGTRPRVFVSGSAIGYYGAGLDDRDADESSPPGDDFLARLCVDWEREAGRAEILGVRTVMARTGVVLAREDGPVPRMVPLFRLFLGGPFLPGIQWWSWVHIADEVGIILLALEDERAVGPINATAPEPVRQREFAATLGRVLGRPSWFPVPAFALRLAMGEMAESFTRGLRVLPRKALELGYRFQYPTLERALRQILVGEGEQT